jgi:hypothetical protein
MDAFLSEVRDVFGMPLLYKTASIGRANDIADCLAAAIIDDEAVLGLEDVVWTAPGVAGDPQDLGACASQVFAGCFRKLEALSAYVPI